MLKNKDIICISSIDWDFAWQGHQETMTRLARAGNRVLFIENTGVRSPRICDLGRIRTRILNWKKGTHGIRKIEDRLYVFSPIVLPFPYLKIARYINKKIMFSVLLRWLKAGGFSEPILWAFLPTGLTLDLIEKIEPQIVVYYCIDSFRDSSKGARKVMRTEKLLLEKADLVFVTSEELFRHCARYSQSVHLFPFGVSIENFKRALSGAGKALPDIQRIKKPIAGYIGGIHKWIDFDLIRYAAEKSRDISFVFCGPIQSDIEAFKDLGNVTFLGYKETEDLPFYVKEFDVAMIPYKITEYTKNVYPTKLNEYLSVGKTVVSTDLPEVRKFNMENNGIVRISSSRDDFVRSIKQAIDHPAGEKESSLAIDTAEKSSWSARIEQMSLLIENSEREKTRQRELSWKANLSRLYRRTKNRLIPAAIVLGLIYVMVFRTPFIWYIARPLQISDAPQRSDVIVALGGGVGESGKVGQGYQERVNTAVSLYDRHFADRILYSSGYRYLMKEAHVMKTLSVGMGVREQDISIDDISADTHEMILRLKEMADKKEWKKIILISSPYHMLRLKLLCDKYLSGSEVLYVPVEKSEYYSRGSGVTLKQIEGILQEYAAILYYKIKKYI
ncbi:MAG: ElyC/SanA/YdcF family protein [Candidatus Omnitrophota bacterium]